MAYIPLFLKCMMAVGLLFLCNSESAHYVKRLGTDLLDGSGCTTNYTGCGSDLCANKTCPIGQKCKLCFGCLATCVLA